MEPWERLELWSARISKFNEARGFLIACILGSIGLGFSILGGTFGFWLPINLMLLVVVAAVGLFAGSWPRPRSWLSMTLVVYINQFLLIAPDFYIAVLVATFVGLIVPTALRGVAALLRYRDAASGGQA